MPDYTIEDRIPALEVTLELLKQLERWMLDDIACQSKHSSSEERAKDNLASDISGKQPEYSIAITESFGTESGTETLATINKFRSSLLPDTTSAIVLKFATPNQSLPQIKIQIAFHLNLILSLFRIEVAGQSAREVARGIEDRLLQILAPQRRLHGFLHSPTLNNMLSLIYGLGVVMFGAAASLIFAVYQNIVVDVSTEGTPPPPMNPFEPLRILFLILIGIPSVLGIVYIFAQNSRPYIIFESQRNRRYASIWKWLIPAFLAFVVFNTIATGFRRSWLGW